MKNKLLWIIALALLFTPVTSLTMLNPAMQHPGKFKSFRQMMRYYKGVERHGLTRTMTMIEHGVSEEMYFYRDGERCRL